MPEGGDVLPFRRTEQTWFDEQGQREAALVDAQAEQSLLGALITHPSRIADLPPDFTSEVYGIEDHGLIHDVIVAHDLSKAPVHEISTALETAVPGLKRYAIGLLGVILGNDRYTVAGLGSHLLDLYRRRRVIETAKQLVADVTDLTKFTADAAIAKGLNEFEGVYATARSIGRPTLSLGAAVQAAIEAHDLAAHGGPVGVATGFASLDAALGPMESGGLYILAGRPAMGKSALGLQIALNVARQGVGVEFVSLEMQAEQLGRRAASFLSGVPHSKLRDGYCNIHDMNSVIGATKALHDLPFSIDDQPGQNVAAIKLKAKAAKRRHGLGLLVVDHLHIVDTPVESTRMGATWAVEQVSKGLKMLAKEMDIPVLALAQLNRGVEGREDKRPALSDLQQAGKIEQDAEATMLLYRPEYYMTKGPPEQTDKQTASAYREVIDSWHERKRQAEGKAEVIFAKGRHSDPQTVTMRFNGALTRFEEVEQRSY